VVARPKALGWKRFIVGPWSTVIFLTKRRSTSMFFFWMALAMADLNNLMTVFAAASL